MEIINRKKEQPSLADKLTESNFNRRKFLRYSGAIGGSVAAAGLLTGLASCHKEHDPEHNAGINLGSGDYGILNYAYALEQLEAAFYTQVVGSPYSEITAPEVNYLTDIRDHEIAHREFFKNVLGTRAIPGLEVNFSSIDFSSRTSVLTTARAFEDLGVSAYNGAGKLIADVNYLLIAGKIVSVEARHAALIRELITPNSFAASDVVDANGLDGAKTPAQVLSVASTFLKSKLDASHLPTS